MTFLGGRGSFPYHGHFQGPGPTVPGRIWTLSGEVSELPEYLRKLPLLFVATP